MLSTITWNTTAAPTGGDWDVAANWNGGKVPGPSDTASITKLTSPGTVYLNSGNADSINSLRTRDYFQRQKPPRKGYLGVFEVVNPTRTEGCTDVGANCPVNSLFRSNFVVTTKM